MNQGLHMFLLILDSQSQIVQYTIGYHNITHSPYTQQYTTDLLQVADIPTFDGDGISPIINSFISKMSVKRNYSLLFIKITP